MNIKIYEVIKPIGGAEVGDMLFYNTEHNTYILSKNDVEVSGTNTTSSSIYVELPASAVEETYADFFRLISTDKEIEQVTEECVTTESSSCDCPICEDCSTVKTQAEITDRLNQVNVAIESLESSMSMYTEENSTLEAMIHVLDSMYKEVEVLNWILNK